MKNISYPFIGIISVENNRETNYIFTEEEFARVSVCRAKKVILRNEKMLINFIHGKYNNTKVAKKDPDWYWSNIDTFPPANSSTFNDVVERLYLCRMNVFCKQNRGKLPFCRVLLNTQVATESLAAILGSIEFLRVQTIGELKKKGLGYKNNLWSPRILFGKEMITITLDMVDMEKEEEYPKLSLYLHRDGAVIPLTKDPFYEITGAPDNVHGEWRLYEYSEDKNCYVNGYSIVIEKEQEE